MFLEKNHIQGKASAMVYVGCFYNEKLIGVMLFKKIKKDCYNLVRFASDINYNCIGVGGKLFKYFVKKYNPLYVETFADRRWTINENDNFYTKIGFSFEKYIKPDYMYYVPENGNKRIHKFNFRKKIISKKHNLPITMTENEMCKKINAYKIWNCGLIKYKFKC